MRGIDAGGFYQFEAQSVGVREGNRGLSETLVGIVEIRSPWSRTGPFRIVPN
jgi:hypothetical protein